MNSGIILSLPTWEKNEIKAFHDSKDNNLPIEISIGEEYVWLTGEQALDLAEFLVTAIEEIPSKEEKTNGSELQET